MNDEEISKKFQNILSQENSSFIRDNIQIATNIFGEEMLEDILKTMLLCGSPCMQWNSMPEDKRKKSLITFSKGLGDVLYFSNRKIFDDSPKVDSSAREAVYGIKLVDNYDDPYNVMTGDMIYIGQAIDFDKRNKEHQRKIKLGMYRYISKYVPSNSIIDIDYEIIKLAIPPESIKNIYIKTLWLSYMECKMIEKYKTYEKGNGRSLTGDTILGKFSE